MSSKSIYTVLMVLCCLSTLLAQEPTLESDLLERTERSLVQLDATLLGPAEVIDSLTKENFSLVVASRRLESFTVDKFCSDEAILTTPTPPGDAPESSEPITITGPAPTYLFYFDQVHLTQAGRHRAIRMARMFAQQLIKDGARASLISNSRELETFIDGTTDPNEFLEALEKMENSPKQWDPFAVQEESRLEEVLRILDRDGTEPALQKARLYAQEERYRSDRALRRLAMVIGRMATAEPPKAVLYFSDTMRNNPGEHYLTLFNRVSLEAFRNDGTGPTALIERDAFFGLSPYQGVINQAAALGVRLYTIEPQGMTTGAVGSRVSSTFKSRVRDAQNALEGFALETGGEAFINSLDPENIVNVVQEDLRCVHLVSFDPGTLPRDEPLAVRLEVDRPEVQVRVRGVVVIQSEKARKFSKLMAAFGASQSFKETNQIPSEIFVIPIEFKNGRYRSLVQFQFQGSPLGGAIWDIGATWIGKFRDIEDDSGQLKLESPNVPVVFESIFTSKPGSYTVVGVGYEQNTDAVVSKESRGEFPNPSESLVTVLPTILLQPENAAFYRDKESRTQGAVVRPTTIPLRADKPTILQTLVCWAKDQKRPLTVERTLSGNSDVPLKAIQFEPDKDRCAIVRDLIKAGDLGQGGFVYRLNVSDKRGPLESAELEFFVQTAEE